MPKLHSWNLKIHFIKCILRKIHLITLQKPSEIFNNSITVGHTKNVLNFKLKLSEPTNVIKQGKPGRLATLGGRMMAAEGCGVWRGSAGRGRGLGWLCALSPCTRNGRPIRLRRHGKNTLLPTVFVFCCLETIFLIS